MIKHWTKRDKVRPYNRSWKFLGNITVTSSKRIEVLANFHVTSYAESMAGHLNSPEPFTKMCGSQLPTNFKIHRPSYPSQEAFGSCCRQVSHPLPCKSCDSMCHEICTRVYCSLVSCTFIMLNVETPIWLIATDTGTVWLWCHYKANN